MVSCACLGPYGLSWPQNLPNLNTILFPYVIYLKLRRKDYLSILNEETVQLTRNSGPNAWSVPTSLGPDEAIHITKSIRPNFFLRVKIVSRNKIKLSLKKFLSLPSSKLSTSPSSSQIQQIGFINLKRLHHTLLMQNTMY